MRLASLAFLVLLFPACEPVSDSGEEPVCENRDVCDGEARITVTCEGDYFAPIDRCKQDETCTDEDADGNAIPAVCLSACGDPQDGKACDPSDLSAVYYADECGERTSVAETCSGGSVCTDMDADGNAVDATCGTGCGDAEAQRVCDASDPGAIHFADACSQVTGVAESCGTDALCTDVDSDGNPIAATCVTGCGDPQDQLVCDSSDPSAVYYADPCGTVTGVAETCDSVSTCDDSLGSAACLCEVEPYTTCKTLSGGGAGLYDETAVVTVDECEATNDEVACDFGTKCYQEGGFFDDEAVCARSLTEAAKDSPYYDNSCSFSDWVRYPSNLDIDCRCRRTGDGQSGPGYADPTTQHNPGNAIINCRPLGELVGKQWPLAFGSGPSFIPYHTGSGTGGDFFGGHFDPVTRELFTVVRWGNANYVRTGALLAFQVDTGARRIISGLYPNPTQGIQSFGSGYDTPRPLGNAGPDQPLTGAASLKAGPDGMLYVAGGGLGETSNKQRFIVRVDPTTGERTLVWRSQHSGSAGQNGTGDISGTYGQCTRHGAQINGISDSVAYTPNAFAIDDSGDFYMTFHGIREGDGMVRISSDGKTCEFLSRFGAQASGGETPANIGGGFTPATGALEGLMLHDGLAWTVTLSGHLLTIDPATGNRVNVGPKPSSGYTGIGYQNLFWDDTRDVVWAVGNHTSYLGSVIDPVNGQRESVFGDTSDYANPILQSDYGVVRSVTSSMIGNGNGIFHGSFVLDPEDNDIVWFTIQGGGLGKMELSTFNSYVHSM